MPVTSAPVSSTASATLLNTGSPRWVVPPFPGVTPPTTLVPNDIASSAWNVACCPVKPWMMTRESLSTKTLMRYLLRGAAAATAFRAASSRSSAWISARPLASRIARPSSTFVPASRTITGTSIAWSRVACTTPCAIQSQRLIPAKMFTRIARTFGVLQDDAERVRDLLGAGAAAHVQEVGRAAAVMHDRVHRPHRQPRAVHDAADRSVERDVVEAVSGRLDLLRVLLVEVAQLDDVALPEQRVVVEAHLAVERDQLAVLGLDERVDLQQAGSRCRGTTGRCASATA